VRVIAKGVKAMSVTVREYRRGGWEVDITFRWPDDSKYRERCKAPVKSKHGALRWGEDRERHLLQHGPPQPKKEVPTLAEFAPRFLDGHARANRHKPSGIAAKESILRVHLIPKLGTRKLDDITTELVQKLKSDLAGSAVKTVNNTLTTLNMLLKKAVEWGVIDRMPCAIRLMPVPNTSASFHDFADYERLLDAAKEHGWRAELIVLLGGEGGLRRGEITGLHWDNVDLSKRQICIQRSDWKGHLTAPKGGRLRYVPMTDRLWAALRQMHRRPGKRVLCQDDGSPMTTKMVADQVSRAAGKAGLTKKGAHVLRHTFCSHLSMCGAPARAIQEAAGHQDLRTTQRYMHLSPSALDEAIRRLNLRPTNAQRGDILETAAGATGN
jgi:integrase